MGDLYPSAAAARIHHSQTKQLSLPANSRQIILTVLLPLSPLLYLFSHILLTVLTRFQMHVVVYLSIFLCYSQLPEGTDA